MINFKKYKVEEIKSNDSDFPDILRRMKNPVKRLRFRGKWDSKIFENSIAIVGSRRSTRYGADILDKFIPSLVGNKLTVVSGFMYGIDTLAHKKTIESGGMTIAVLGSGLDICTPPENERLYMEIIENNGLVISEYEDDFKSTVWSFPQRNRIVVGLSNRGVLVVEAGLKSGSLITARIANEVGRDVYAVPGSIFSKTSSGCNQLICELKANLVTTPEDILHLPHQYSEENQLKLFENVTPQEKEILDILNREPSSIDEIARESGKSAYEISGTLTIMGLKNIVEEDGGKFGVCKL